MEYYIAHHGVKGMKWGVRRYQNADGTLTAAGKARQNMLQKKSAYIREYLRNPDGADEKKSQYEIATGNFKDAKTLEKLQNQKKKSKRQEKLEQQYLEKGYTKEEAAIKAYRRAQKEKALIGIGAVAATAAVAYGGYKLYKDRVDKFIDPGVSFQRVTKDNDQGLHDIFYAANKKGDIQKYKGMYAEQIKMQGSNDVFTKTIEIKDRVKMASPKNASDTLRNLITSDSQAKSDMGKIFKEYDEDFKEFMGAKQARAIEKGYRDFKAGKINRNVYNLYNMAINNRYGDDTQAYDRLRSKYTGALKSKGYDALLDVNDTKFSGYKSKNPVIFINNSKMAVTKVSQLSNHDIAENAAAAQLKLLGSSLLKKSAVAAAVGTAASGLSSMVVDKQVEQYRKKHPETKMSYQELAARARRGDI